MICYLAVGWQGIRKLNVLKSGHAPPGFKCRDLNSFAVANRTPVTPDDSIARRSESLMKQ
jgi:hypothetical protein